MKKQTIQRRKAFKEPHQSELPQTHIPSKKVYKYYNKYFLDLNPTTLKQQSIKRIHAKNCRFNSRTEENYDYLKTLDIAMKSLKRMKNRKITFHFDFRIIYTKFSFFTESLKINPCLRSLYLDFDESHIKNETLCRLRKVLKRTRFLNDLDLSFYKCVNLYEMGMLSLSQGLNSLANLRIINLKFGDCHQVRDGGLCYISKILYSRLENVVLDFYGCEVTERGLRQVNRCFKKLVNLKEIFLKFEWSRVTISELQRMKTILESLPSLPKVHFLFEDEYGENYY